MSRLTEQQVAPLPGPAATPGTKPAANPAPSTTATSPVPGDAPANVNTQKRAAPDPTSAADSPPEKKARIGESYAKATGECRRPCDNCRTHQLRCAGKLPCDACFKERMACTFKTYAHPTSSSPPDGEALLATADASYQALADLDLARDAPDIVPLQFPTRYAGEETPPLVFLHRAWRRIARALEQPGLTPAQAAVRRLSLPSGDQPYDTSRPYPLQGELDRWLEMQRKLAAGWTETFHFLHRPTARTWLNSVHRNYASRAPLEFRVGHAKAAIAIMTIALGSLPDRIGDHPYLITQSLTDSEPGPPTLESVQARLLQVLYMLCTCRLGQASYGFGAVVHMMTALGLHRRRGRNKGLGLEIVHHPEYAKVQCERRTFWSAYILDKQLALMSGRPSYFNLDIVDQDFPDCVNDEDMGPAGPFRPHKGDCYVEALVEQAKLSKLVERVMREVYTLSDVSEDSRLKCALRLGKAIEDWKAQLPFLMGRLKLSLLHPTYRRQAALLQLTHWHAQILAYRPFLTAAYPRDREKQRIADYAIHTCVEAARAALDMVLSLAYGQDDDDRSHFDRLLYAHHLTYCAASVLFLLPHIRERQIKSGGGPQNHNAETDAELFELAQKAIRALVASTSRYSPARRWAVILEELRDEAAQQVPKVRASDGQPRPGSDPESPDQQLIEDALRAHWEADLTEDASNTKSENGTAAHSAPGIAPRLWDNWRTTDWLDLDAAAFGPISAFENGDIPIAPPKP